MWLSLIQVKEKLVQPDRCRVFSSPMPGSSNHFHAVPVTMNDSAIGYYSLTTRFTGSILFERDLMAKDALDDRLGFNIDTILRIVSI